MPDDATEVVGEVCVVAEPGADVLGVDGVDDVLLREAPDPVLLELPELEQGVLGALVRRRLQQVAVDLRRQRGLLRRKAESEQSTLYVQVTILR